MAMACACQPLTVGTSVSSAGHPAIDPHSCAQAGQVRVVHLDLDLVLDFALCHLAGQATLHLDWLDPTATVLLVDTRDLDIERVEALVADGQAQVLDWSLGTRDEQLGCALRIEVPQRPARVRIHYRTSLHASGLQWLTPE